MPITNSKYEKLLGIHIDSKLTFEPHVRFLCKKASQKLNAFARIAFSLKFNKRKLLLNAFITTRFSYAPVVWKFRSRKLNNHINWIHKKALRILFQYHNPMFEDLLAKDGCFKIHGRNLRRLLIEIFKVKIELASETMNEVFDIIESTYPLRSELRFKPQNIYTVRYRTEAAAFADSRIWSYMTSELKVSLNVFRLKIKNFKPKNCTCSI